MDDKDLDIVIEEDSDDNDEIDGSITDLDESLNDDEGDNAPSNNGNKNASNFKKLSKALKEARKEAANERKNREMLEERVKFLENYLGTKNEDSEEEDTSQSYDVDKVELLEFIIEHPEARQHKEEIIKTLSRFNGMTIEEAYRYVKANTQMSSETKDNYDLSVKHIQKRKRLEDLTEDEVYKMVSEKKLTNQQLLQWKRSKKLI